MTIPAFTSRGSTAFQIVLLLTLLLSLVRGQEISFQVNGLVNTGSELESFVKVTSCNDPPAYETLPTLPSFAVANPNSSVLFSGSVKLRLTHSELFCGKNTNEFIINEENNQYTSKERNRSGFRDDGYFRIAQDYFGLEEYCVDSYSPERIVIKFCPPTCQGTRPCIPKCFPPDEVLSFYPLKRPKSSGAVKYFPKLYTDFTFGLNLSTDDLRPHFVQHHPKRDLSCEPHQIIINPYSKDVSDKLGVIPIRFRIEVSGEVFLEKKDEYNCIKLHKLPDRSFCVDGIQDIGQEDPYTNNETEGIFFSCPLPESENVLQQQAVSTMYGVIMILSSNFLLPVIIVYALLWHLQSIHGWTIMAHAFTVFCAYIFLGVAHILGSGVLGNSGRTACYVIGVFAYYFFISKFLWLTILNFDLWWTFRAVRATQQHTTKRMMIQMYIGWGLPLLVIAVSVTLEALIGDTCTSILLPRFGDRRVCFVSPPSRGLYIYYPIAVTLVGNLVFFVLTCYKLYGYGRVSVLPKNQMDKHKQMALLFLKMFIVTGITWIFELISWLATGDDTAWYWTLVDIFNLLQAVGICIIYICKRDIYNSLESKYPALASYVLVHFRCCPCCRPQEGPQPTSASSTDKTRSTTTGL